jgi:hypothetical protein
MIILGDKSRLKLNFRPIWQVDGLERSKYSVFKYGVNRFVHPKNSWTRIDDGCVKLTSEYTMMLQQLDACVSRQESFALETTLSGKNYLKRIRSWREDGYRVSLYFLSLPNAEMAISRVAERVAQGGHHVPKDVIRRRFDGGLANFEEAYKKVVNLWMKIDNSGESPILLETGTNT